MLYLHFGPPSGPRAKALETAEGHTVEYDEHGAIVGLELMGVRGTLERGGRRGWRPKVGHGGCAEEPAPRLCDT